MKYVVGMLYMACGATSKSHWHDNNIVLIDGHWALIPNTTYGSPHAPLDDRWKSPKATIIVLVAALREDRLPVTIMSAFDNAKYPHRVRFGIVQQNDDSDPDALESVCNQRGTPLVKIEGKFSNPNNCVEFSKVRMLRMHSSEAKGPVYARGQQPKLVEEEDFCMQIDAHTVFKQDWDVLMLEQWGMTENEFAVLSTYPTNHKDLEKNSNNHWEMPHICAVNMNPSGEISNRQAGAVAMLDRPALAPFWAAGLSFSRCHAERNVPNDPNMKQIFSGEEFSRGARLWTHGYDFYSITRPIIGVYYGGEKGNHGSWHSDRTEAKISQNRLMTLLKLPNSNQSEDAIKSLGSFALGSKRALEQYIEFSGADTINVKTQAKCIVYYVPWEDSQLCQNIRKQDEQVSKQFNRNPYPVNCPGDAHLLFHVDPDNILALDLSSPGRLKGKFIGEHGSWYGLMFILALIFLSILGYACIKRLENRVREFSKVKR